MDVLSNIRIALLMAGKSSMFLLDATLYFICKKNDLWAKRDEHSKFDTATMIRCSQQSQAYIKLWPYLLAAVLLVIHSANIS